MPQHHPGLLPGGKVWAANCAHPFGHAGPGHRCGHRFACPERRRHHQNLVRSRVPSAPTNCSKAWLRLVPRCQGRDPRALVPACLSTSIITHHTRPRGAQYTGKLRVCRGTYLVAVSLAVSLCYSGRPISISVGAILLSEIANRLEGFCLESHQLLQPPRVHEHFA